MTNSTGWGGKRLGAGRKFKFIRLSPGETMLVLDALNGVMIDRDNAEFQLPLEIEDGIKINHLDAKWKVDGAELIRKITHLSHQAAIEIVESTDRFWQSQ